MHQRTKMRAGGQTTNFYPWRASLGTQLCLGLLGTVTLMLSQQNELKYEVQRNQLDYCVGKTLFLL